MATFALKHACHSANTARACAGSPGDVENAKGRRPGPWALRGLIFDMGDVLHDATAWRRWLHGLLNHLGVGRDYASLFDVWDGKYLNAVHRGQRDYHEAFVTFLIDLGLSLPEIDEVCAASAARRRQIAASLRPLPGVRPTLERLRAMGLVLGVLSDSEDTAPRLRERLESLGIGRFLEVVVSSRDLGRTKPAHACYESALAAMRLAPAQAAFVGHDADELRGATGIGMKTIAFNNAVAVRADLCLARFDQLAEHIVLASDKRPSAARPPINPPVVLQ